MPTLQEKSQTSQPAPSTTPSYLVFALLSVSLIAYVIQFGMISVALDDLIADLDAPIRWGAWVLTIFMTGQVISLSVSGRLSDRVGPRNLFVMGFAIFSGASLLCALAPNIYVLIAGRLVQGLGGGSLVPSGMALIAQAFENNRARAIGFYSSLIPFGAVFGPTIGGVLVDLAGWRSTFFINIPLGLLVVFTILIVLPEGRREAPKPIDLVGILLLGGAILTLIFMITELGRDDPGPSIPLLAVSGGASAILWALFALQERSTAVPALDIGLLARLDLLASNMTAFISGMCWIGVFSIVPFYIQRSYGLSASAAGAIMGPRAAAMVGASTLAAFVLHRTGYHRPVLFGLVVMASSVALLALGAHDPSVGPVQVSSFWWLTLVVIIAGTARGLMNPSLNNAGMDVFPDRIAAIAGLRATFQSFGGLLGISFMALVAARSGDVTSGLQLGFWVAAVMLLGTMALVPLIPQLPGWERKRSSTAE